MGKQTARVDDPTDHGGQVISGSATRLVNGKPVARIDDQVSCPQHGVNKITTGSSDVLVEGKGIAWVGSRTECGATITQGSSNVETDV